MRAQRYIQQSPGARPAGDAAEDKRYGKVYDARVIRRLWPFMVPYRRSLFLAMTCTLGVSLSHLIAPYLVKLSLDGYIAHGNLPGLAAIVCAYAGNAVVGWILQYRQVLLLERTAQYT